MCQIFTVKELYFYKDCEFGNWAICEYCENSNLMDNVFVQLICWTKSTLPFHFLHAPERIRTDQTFFRCFVYLSNLPVQRRPFLLRICLYIERYGVGCFALILLSFVCEFVRKDFRKLLVSLLYIAGGGIELLVR